MRLYFVGKIVSVKKTYVIMEHNFIGYVLNIADPSQFEVSDKYQKIYVYEHRTEYMFKRYAFKSFKERIMFDDLLSLPGIGPRTGLSILKNGVDKIITMIINADIAKLAQVPYISARSARQIIIELQEKYSNMSKNAKKIESDKIPDTKNYDELKNTLKILGFKKQQIQLALGKLSNFNLPHEKLVEESIRVISNVG